MHFDVIILETIIGCSTNYGVQLERQVQAAVITVCPNPRPMDSSFLQLALRLGHVKHTSLTNYDAKRYLQSYLRHLNEHQRYLALQTHVCTCTVICSRM